MTDPNEDTNALIAAVIARRKAAWPRPDSRQTAADDSGPTVRPCRRKAPWRYALR